MQNPGSPAQMMLMVTDHDLRFPTRQSYLAKNERCISKTSHRYLLIPGCMQWYAWVPKPPSLSLSCLGRDNREQLLTGAERRRGFQRTPWQLLSFFLPPSPSPRPCRFSTFQHFLLLPNCVRTRLPPITTRNDSTLISIDSLKS